MLHHSGSFCTCRRLQHYNPSADFPAVIVRQNSGSQVSPYVRHIHVFSHGSGLPIPSFFVIIPSLLVEINGILIRFVQSLIFYRRFPVRLRRSVSFYLCVPQGSSYPNNKSRTRLYSGTAFLLIKISDSKSAWSVPPDPRWYRPCRRAYCRKQFRRSE